MIFEELRGFLAQLERERQLLRVTETVDPHLESTALCLRAGGPALLMEKAGTSAQPLPGNLFGHRRRMELALAGRPLALLRELGQIVDDDIDVRDGTAVILGGGDAGRSGARYLSGGKHADRPSRFRQPDGGAGLQARSGRDQQMAAGNHAQLGSTDHARCRGGEPRRGDMAEVDAHLRTPVR